MGRYTLESEFEKHVLSVLKPLGYFMAVDGKGSSRGVPDIVGVVAGVFVALELKLHHKETQQVKGRGKLQEYRLYQIEKNGGMGFLVSPDNLEEVLEILRQTKKHHK